MGIKFNTSVGDSRGTPLLYSNIWSNRYQSGSPYAVNGSVGFFIDAGDYPSDASYYIAQSDGSDWVPFLFGGTAGIPDLQQVLTKGYTSTEGRIKLISNTNNTHFLYFEADNAVGPTIDFNLGAASEEQYKIVLGSYYDPFTFNSLYMMTQSEDYITMQLYEDYAAIPQGGLVIGTDIQDAQSLLGRKPNLVIYPNQYGYSEITLVNRTDDVPADINFVDPTDGLTFGFGWVGNSGGLSFYDDIGTVWSVDPAQNYGGFHVFGIFNPTEITNYFYSQFLLLSSVAYTTPTVNILVDNNAKNVYIDNYGGNSTYNLPAITYFLQSSPFITIKKVGSGTLTLNKTDGDIFIDQNGNPQTSLSITKAAGSHTFVGVQGTFSGSTSGFAWVQIVGN